MASDLRTLPGWIEHWAKTKPNTDAIYDRLGPGNWRALTWSQYWNRVRAIGKGLISLGVEKGDVVAIMASNRTDYVCCQHASAATGTILAPIYVTNTVEQVAYIIGHSAAKVAISDGAELLQKYLDGSDGDDVAVEHYITFDKVDSDHAKVKSLEELIALGEADPEADAKFDAVYGGLEPDDLTMLIFTSGTTGLPKGAMYTHRSINCTGSGITSMYDQLGDTIPVRSLSYLPLCHAAEQCFTNMVGLRLGGEVFFLGDLTLLKEALPEVKPTVFLGVPRVWEKFEAALKGKLALATGLKAKLVPWALKTELDAFYQSLPMEGEYSSFFRKVANKLVISKIKAVLGLDDLYLAFTGAAPISKSTLEFFASLGIPPHEAYGMTETTAVATVQVPGKPRMGTIGKAFPGVTVRIAEDGEIQLRGDNMVKGYYKLPEKSAELWTDDEWMTTGDLGTLDNDGYVRITGRKKDIIITAGGKNVAPAEIEGYLQAFPGVGQAVVVGDRQPYLCALLVLDPEALPELEKAAGVSGGSVKALAENPAVVRFFDKKVASEVNPNLARYQTVKKFKIMTEPFSVEGGELTPTMKVKRNVVNEKYAAQIEALYATDNREKPAAE